MYEPFIPHPFNPGPYVARVTTAAHDIAQRIGPDFPTPVFSLTLGSGLAGLLQVMDVHVRIPYRDIRFPLPVANGHAGELVVGRIAGVPVACLSGRTHYNEVSHLPHGIMAVVFATHVMASLGVRICFTTNAAGGLDRRVEGDFRQSRGDVLIVRDHINMIPNPISGPHLDFGTNPYFVPLAGAYPEDLQLMLLDACQYAGQDFRRGVYLGLPGRPYETAAECRMYRAWGADAVGMSTTPEIIAAVSRGMRTMAVSVITNVVAEDGTNATDHEEVTAVLEDPKVRARLTAAFARFFELYAENPDRYAGALS